MGDYTDKGLAITAVIVKLFPLYEMLHAAGDTLTKDVGLTSSRWQILSAIEQNSETVANIGRRVGLSRQAVLRSVALLAKQGFVELLTNPAHKRAALVSLTDKGRDIYALISKKQRTWANQLAAAMELSEIQSALHILKSLENKLPSSL